MKKIILLLLFIPVFILAINISYYLLNFILKLAILLIYAISKEAEFGLWWYDILVALVSEIIAFNLSFKTYPYYNKIPALIILTILTLALVFVFYIGLNISPITLDSFEPKDKVKFIMNMIGYGSGLIIVWYITLKSKGEWN